mmetsp:Transcript_6916/g.19633  ORF Transcript_6916/g.19633 Transcript_6916/m.19633 type:complete len:241 (+) Transcript_6916:1467-2189(+)
MPSSPSRRRTCSWPSSHTTSAPAAARCTTRTARGCSAARGAPRIGSATCPRSRRTALRARARGARLLERRRRAKAAPSRARPRPRTWTPRTTPRPLSTVSAPAAAPLGVGPPRGSADPSAWRSSPSRRASPRRACTRAARASWRAHVERGAALHRVERGPAHPPVLTAFGAGRSGCGWPHAKLTAPLETPCSHPVSAASAALGQVWSMVFDCAKCYGMWASHPSCALAARYASRSAPWSG